MKRFMVLVVLLFVMNFIAGCGGMASNYPERKRRISNINDTYERQIVDDWDYIWMYERVSYLSEWPVRDTDD